MVLVHGTNPTKVPRLVLLNSPSMSAQVHILGQQQSLFTQFLSEIRDTEIQKDSLRFRRNLERLGEIFAYEISKVLEHRERDVQTRGLLNYFDQAENTFISAYRKHHGDADSFEVEIEYLSSPSLEGKTVILCDPMLATGSSMVLAYQALLERGVPGQVHVVVIIASTEGLEFAQKQLPADTSFWIGAVDEELTPRKYIVPGLGDAGDLAYGAKD